MKTTIDITSIQLSNRQQHGEYTTWDALSSDGVHTYQVTVNGDGKCTGCSCPATVPNCKHARAAEFEFAWTESVQREMELSTAAAVVACVMPEMVQDMAAHLEDDGIVEGEFVDPFAGMTKAQQQEAYRALYPDDFYFAA